jgi:hypothetical protein
MNDLSARRSLSLDAVTRVGSKSLVPWAACAAGPLSGEGDGLGGAVQGLCFPGRAVPGLPHLWPWSTRRDGVHPGTPIDGHPECPITAAWEVPPAVRTPILDQSARVERGCGGYAEPGCARTRIDFGRRWEVAPPGATR